MSCEGCGQDTGHDEATCFVFWREHFKSTLRKVDGLLASADVYWGMDQARVFVRDAREVIREENKR